MTDGVAEGNTAEGKFRQNLAVVLNWVPCRSATKVGHMTTNVMYIDDTDTPTETAPPLVCMQSLGGVQVT
jgi:hypothetical protein